MNDDLYIIGDSHIIVAGNPVDGYEFIGPFASYVDALEKAESISDSWWIAKLTKG